MNVKHLLNYIVDVSTCTQFDWTKPILVFILIGDENNITS